MKIEERLEIIEEESRFKDLLEETKKILKRIQDFKKNTNPDQFIKRESLENLTKINNSCQEKNMLINQQ